MFFRRAHDESHTSARGENLPLLRIVMVPSWSFARSNAEHMMPALSGVMRRSHLKCVGTGGGVALQAFVSSCAFPLVIYPMNGTVVVAATPPSAMQPP